ncbi:hypothetical protein LMG19089_02909 [Ralstonia edaphis]|uniref:hypothetical protein n=1 Tax=Ralstonia edaphi TaxID=3058599 RepID=UPI0028F4FF3F|nr:hypothetical protein [Ralstonia sp. LMG 6871]CAJ0701718.1 hypothetical protein LMG19089_02909 [Ralstonia sp. LMG 6871]
MDILSQDEKRICDLIVNDPTYCSSGQGYDPQPYMALLMQYLRRGDFSPVEMERTLNQLTAQCLRDVNWTLTNEAKEDADAADTLIAEDEARGRMERSLGMSLPHAA